MLTGGTPEVNHRITCTRSWKRGGSENEKDKFIVEWRNLVCGRSRSVDIQCVGLWMV